MAAGLDLRRLQAAVLTVVLGGAGGALFAWLDLPAPWMSGALVATSIWAVAGKPLAVPDPLRGLTFVVLGASMGGALTPDALKQAAAWPISMAFLALSVAAVVAGCTLYFRRMAGWDMATALYASAPGALSAVIAMAETTTADMRKVAFAQGVRLFLLVAALPNLLHAAGLEPGVTPVPPEDGPWLGIALLLLASGAAGLVFEWLKVPGGLLLGAMGGSAALHLTGLSTAHIPALMLIPAFVVLGTTVGIRFEGTRFATLRESVIASLGGFAVGMAISVAFAVAAAAVTGEDTGKMVTAFAPGALETMTALGFALGYDPAFMSAHHLFRFTGLSIALPLSAHLLFSLTRGERERTDEIKQPGE
ncbi:membrane protein [Azorhizobium oxalatiphilum]|uniref:Membrane protein n=1 Tax=Azorhizobium oxalatiphilum TaxID=980631 RepID=A0A917FH77_9HYPH|nr:AbrB family transcriptional regulator [Azorhizobium oxalatiphilum]GGF75785.1 membrane protein [Azorhizobium oxalatiphilum]